MTIEVMEILNNELNSRNNLRVIVDDEFNPSQASAVLHNEALGRIVEGTCLRKLWYTYKNVEPDEDEVESRVTIYGDVVSAVEVDLAKKSGIYLGHEVSFSKVYKNIRIRGRADLLVEVTTSAGNKERIGVEFKSVGSYASRKGTVTPDKETGRYEPKVAHTLQSAIYLDCFRDLGFTHWQVVYIDRSNGEVSIPSHKVLLDGSGVIHVNGKSLGINVNHIYDRWVELKKKLDTDSIPDRDFAIEYDKKRLDLMLKHNLLSKTDASAHRVGKLKKGDWQCAFCAWRFRCWNMSSSSEEPTMADAVHE